MFIQTAANTSIDGPHSLYPIAAVCATTAWIPGLIFTCNHSNGGIGNVRNMILTCIRYAIDAGASLVIPRILVGSDEDTGTIVTADTSSFSYFFDQAYFVDVMREVCPQMRLYEHTGDLMRWHSAQHAISLDTLGIADGVKGRVLAHPERWRGSFSAWLEKEKLKPEADRPVLVDIGKPFLEFPVEHDAPEFAATFGRILQFRPDIWHLAASSLYTLSKRFSLNISASDRITSRAYMGAHLRTEEDGGSSVAPPAALNLQTDRFLELALKSNLSIIYVAGGSSYIISRFAIKARENHNVTVITKNDLLDGPESDQLRRLSREQQALVDYLMMCTSSVFGGVVSSSFSWNIALQRHLTSRMLDAGRRYLEGPQAVSDDLSQVFGRVGENGFFAEAMWP